MKCFLDLVMSWWFVVGHRRIRQYLHNFNNLILVILFQYAEILYFFYNEHFVTQQIHLAFPENVVMVLSTGYISPLLLPQTPSFPKLLFSHHQMVLCCSWLSDKIKRIFQLKRPLCKTLSNVQQPYLQTMAIRSFIRSFLSLLSSYLLSERNQS